MLESDNAETTSPTDPSDTATPRKRAPRKSAAKKAQPAAETGAQGAATEPAATEPAATEPAATEPAAGESAAAEPAAPRKRAPRKAAAKAASPPAARDGAAGDAPAAADAPAAGDAPAKKTARKAAKKPAKKAAKIAVTGDGEATVEPPEEGPASDGESASAAAIAPRTPRKRAAKKAAAETATGTDAPDDALAPSAMTAPGVVFMAPTGDASTDAATGDAAPKRRRPAKKTAAAAAAPESDTTEPEPGSADLTTVEDAEDQTAEPEDVREAAIEQASGARRRRRRGRRGRGGAKAESGDADDQIDETTDADDAGETAPAETDGDEAPAGGAEGTGTTRRRRRRRSGSSGDGESGDPADEPPNTVTHVREPRKSDDGVRGVKGSTRLEAKRQRRRDGRETTRRRAPILTESEFLARREAVDRVMVVRQTGERTQIAVLEDDMLVEHYVTRASATSYVGNVYLGRVQNVLPSMEAAFIDIGKGRNGVLYAGEVNWDAAGLEGKSRSIETALKSGDSVLVQVSKDPIGHKGARLTSQISLPGRFLVYVPGGGMTGISRRLPDTERHRLKTILKKIVPDEAGVIVRTAAEGASEEDLTRDVERLTSQWAAIEEAAAKAGGKGGNAPVLLHGEPDLAIRVVRDVFNEDFKSLVVQGDDAWQTVSDYVGGVAPDLGERVSKHVGNGDVFHELRIDEQLMKALDRKVWLPSGGSLVIDRTEAMTVIDVNTGKFVGSGGNLEQTVTRNNLEAAEEIVRQLRLRDVGGIVVIDFIDMVLESNRDLVLRRLTECLGRDRTKHQVAEVTSLGLVQMTRKRVGEGLLEAFSETCEHCNGRGVLVHTEPIDKSNSGGGGQDDEGARSKPQRKRGARAAAPEPEPAATDEQRKAANAAIAAIHRAANGEKNDDDAGLVDELASGLVAAARDADSTPEPPPVPATELAQTVVESVARLDERRDAGTGRRRRRRVRRRIRRRARAHARAHARAPSARPAPPPGREPPGRSAHGRVSVRVLPRQRSVP